MSRKSTPKTIGNMLRSAAGALVRPQADPPTPSPDAGSESNPTAAASAPASEPIDTQAGRQPVTTDTPPQADPTHEETLMNEPNPIIQTTETPENAASVTVRVEPPAAPPRPPVLTRWLYAVHSG